MCKKKQNYLSDKDYYNIDNKRIIFTLIKNLFKMEQIKIQNTSVSVEGHHTKFKQENIWKKK